MAVAGLKLLVQTEEMSLLARLQLQEQAKESPAGMRLLPVRWVPPLLCSPLEKPLLAHQL